MLDAAPAPPNDTAPTAAAVINFLRYLAVRCSATSEHTSDPDPARLTRERARSGQVTARDDVESCDAIFAAAARSGAADAKMTEPRCLSPDPLSLYPCLFLRRR